MKLLRSLSPCALSLALVGAALAVSLSLPVHSHAAASPRAEPVRDLFGNPERACLQPPASGRMVEALSKCSSEVPSPVDDNHGSRKEANLREFKGAMAAFLARQPKPQVQRQQAERIASVDPYHGLRPPPLRYRQTRPRLAGEPEPGAPLRRFQASRCSRRPPGRLAGHLQLAGRAQPPRHDLAQAGRRDASRRRRRRQRACVRACVRAGGR